MSRRVTKTVENGRVLADSQAGQRPGLGHHVEQKYFFYEGWNLIGETGESH